MNKKVLKTMIALVVVFLLACYVLKFFFPKQFVMAIENENIVKIGNYVDGHKWLQIVCAFITSFVIYWFYLCACLRRWWLKWQHIVVVLVIIGVTQGLYELDATLASGFSIVAMLVVPVLFRADLNIAITTFAIHYSSQLISTQIRQLPLLMTNINFATVLFLGLESYFWLLLCYLFFNFKEKKNG